MTQGELFAQALKRPVGYQRMSERERWKVDKELGLLDWDGSCPHNPGYPCDECEDKYWKNQNGKSV